MPIGAHVYAFPLPDLTDGLMSQSLLHAGQKIPMHATLKWIHEAPFYRFHNLQSLKMPLQGAPLSIEQLVPEKWSLNVGADDKMCLSFL